VVICLEQSADCLIDCPADATASQTLTSLASFKCRLLIPTWYWLTQVILENRPLNGCSSGNYSLCPGLPRWAGTRKVKPIWILLKQETVSGSGISWAVCKSAPWSRQISNYSNIWFKRPQSDLTYIYNLIWKGFKSGAFIAKTTLCKHYCVLCTVYLLWVIMPRI